MLSRGFLHRTRRVSLVRCCIFGNSGCLSRPKSLFPFLPEHREVIVFCRFCRSGSRVRACLRTLPLVDILPVRACMLCVICS